MNTRIINTEELIQLEQALNFDRYNLYALGKNFSTDIERANKLLSEAEEPIQSEYKELCRRVGLYYALYKRSKLDAKPYLEQYLKLTQENTYEQAEAYGFLGYISVISGDYHESHEKAPLNIALGILKNLDQNDLHNIRLQIFLGKYIPLMRYRDSYLNLSAQDKRPYILEDMEAAITGIKIIIKQAEEYSGTQVDIDRAESIHLLAAMLIKKGMLSEAKKELEAALELEKDFSRKITKQLYPQQELSSENILFHWMTFTTGQTLADLYRREKNFDGAVKLLTESLAGQQHFFAPLTNHPDIAKTLDFLANTHGDKGDCSLAFEGYLATLDMKEKILERHSFLIQVTLKSMINLMSLYPQLSDQLSQHLLQALQFINHEFFDWNNYKTIAFSEKIINDIEMLLSQISFESLTQKGLDLTNDLHIQIAKESVILQYKIGAFYAHIRKSPEGKNSVDHGLERLSSLPSGVLECQDVTWIELHIAYLYQQKLAASVSACRKLQSVEDKECETNKRLALVFCEEALEYANRTEISHEQSKILAFAYCIRALVTYESVILDKKTLEAAIKDYKIALQIYNDIDAIYDGDQYPRALSRKAMMTVDLIKVLMKEEKDYLLQNQHELANDVKSTMETLIDEVMADYLQIEKNYWMKTKDAQVFYTSDNCKTWAGTNDSPYPARFLKSFAEFLEFIDQPASAQLRYQAAHMSLCKIEGKDKPFTQDMLDKSEQMKQRIQDKQAVIHMRANNSPVLFKAVNNDAVKESIAHEEKLDSQQLPLNSCGM